ncbi:MAG: hypothetical protein VKL39_16260, partial [Leptolyngbyaceae bacterium]|nr:hypothetical protein [Leptolyngbyaceae bacterium]
QALPDLFPELTCIAGEIPLENVLTSNEDTVRALYQQVGLAQVSDPRPIPAGQEFTRMISPLMAHSSGLSIYGAIALPWEMTPIASPFQLAQTFPADDPKESLRLTLETERLTRSEQQHWIAAWKRLSQYLTPRNPLNGPVRTTTPLPPNWVTLEVTNPTAIPNLYWMSRSISDDQAENAEDQPSLAWDLNFADDSFSLILSNQSPYDSDNPPTSLARISPNVKIMASPESDENQAIQLMVTAGEESTQTNEAYDYHYDVDGDETITLSQLALAFNPVEVPRFIRERQGLPLPVRSLPAQPASGDRESPDLPDPVNPPVLWAFMPLERGWFQFPIPNLTEQIYLDSGLARVPSTDTAENNDPPTLQRALVQGAVSLGTDNLDLLETEYANEQPWNLVLTNAAFVEGTWTLTADATETPTQTYRLTTVDLHTKAPELILNGLFWLSTERPSSQDALPDLENWVSGVRSHPLRTIRDTDLFPSVVVLALSKLTLSARRPSSSSPANPQPVTAALGAWDFSYRVDEAIFEDFVQNHVLPTHTFSQVLPWVWQHHPALPMIQALPLSQTQTPPNYPSASRQLVPFELNTLTVEHEGSEFAVPDRWRFVVNGAESWPQPIAAPLVGGVSTDEPSDDLTLTVAREWGDRFDLPLVSLSLPGLILDPTAMNSSLPVDSVLDLPVQYRFDLPYSDEVNALAELPEPPQDPETVSPLPDSPLPEPPEPLVRTTFQDHWFDLSRRASLASADAVTALSSTPNGIGDGNSLSVHTLLEPFIWPVDVAADLSTYPGTLTLTNQQGANGASLLLDGTGALELSELQALEGISGRFTQNGTAFDIVAGSLVAPLVTTNEDQRGLRDQRGLTRFASQVENTLIQTPLTFQVDPTTSRRYDL